MPKKNIKRCSLIKPNRRKCTNHHFKDGLCKLHFNSQEDRKMLLLTKGNQTPFGIYADGLKIEEQEQFYDVKVGTLECEIRTAKLLLNRMMKEKFEHDLKQRGLNAIPIKRIKFTDIAIGEDGKPHIPVGKNVVISDDEDDDGKKMTHRYLADSEMISEMPDYDDKINRLLDIIRKLEVAHYEIQGGIHSDPQETAKQIMAFITQIDKNAFGEDDG